MHESYDVEPALRSDASRCDPAISRDEAESVLREAIARGCVSADFDGDLPRYVWTWIRGRPHETRLVNRDA